MLNQKVIEYFERFPKLKVLFFFDAEKEYINETENFDAGEIILIKGINNFFTLKYKLETELKNSKVFLYFTTGEPKGEDRKKFVLLDILVANKTLYLDETENIIKEFNLSDTNRPLVKKYIKYLKVKKHKTILARILNDINFNETNLKKGLVFCLLNAPEVEDDTLLIIRLITGLLDNNADKVIEKIKEINSESLVANIINTYFGLAEDNRYEEIALSTELFKSLAIRIKYNILTKNIKKETITNDKTLKNVDYKNNPDKYFIRYNIKDLKYLDRIVTLFNDWQKHTTLSKQLEFVWDNLASEIDEVKILEHYGVNQKYGYYSNKFIINIIKKTSKDIEYNPGGTTKILNNLLYELIENRSELGYFIKFLIDYGNINIILNSSDGYTYNKPEEYIIKYTETFYLIDTYFRKALEISADFSVYETIRDNFDYEVLIDSLQKRYVKFLIDYNIGWIKCIKDFNFEFNNIPVLKQYEFYNKFIDNSDNKVAVIISDAFRYECASELNDELKKDPKYIPEIKYALASIPSNTKQGMTNLLPYNKIEFNNETFLIDDISTEGLENREKILKKRNAESRAVSFDYVNSLTRDEARELFKNKVVYIYHNHIDAIGDDRNTERQTIDAVRKTIKDLTGLIKKIHSSYNVSRVIITADHGFLYNHIDLPESMYERLPDSEALVNHNRYSVFANRVVSEGYIFEMSKCSNINNANYITIPKAINRYKRQGHGALFVHGGASVQELIIPIIESIKKREEVTEIVPFKVINRKLTIVSSALKLTILQEKALDEGYREVEINVGIYDEFGKLVSNEQFIMLDSVSQTPTDRTTEILLNLQYGINRNSQLFLMIYDHKKDINKTFPLVKLPVVNQTLIEPEF
jgi:uncharacterized protein (TIGR02687 family)